MIDCGTREITRIENQRRLDALKTAGTRNKLGQFATPLAIAVEITEYAVGLMSDSDVPVRFLDPAVGTGAFYSALRHVLTDNRVGRCLGIEIDPEFAQFARALWGETGLDVVEGDFTRQSPPPADQRFNLILTNPPYVRHHHLDQADKERLRRMSSAVAGRNVSGLSGLYCHFMFLCHDWMEDNGLGVWLIPSEFMDVNYGEAVRAYLANKVTLLHIHRFRAEDLQFDDALVSSAVVIFRKTAPPADHHARFSYGGRLCSPDIETLVSLPELSRPGKWTRSCADRASGSSSLAECADTLGDLFTIKRGIATGSNSFFIVPKQFVSEHNIPVECVKPILPSPRRLKESVIDSDADGYPAIDHPLAVIDSSYPEGMIRERFPDFWAYLQAGRELGIHKTYLASRRSPWYSQEQRPAAPFICTYMGRAVNNSTFRFMWNRSRAIAPNVYLLLYPKPFLRELLDKDPALYPRVLSALQSIDMQALTSAGRVYGGGLHKLEPKELCAVSADRLLQAIDTAGPRLRHQPGLF